MDVNSGEGLIDLPEAVKKDDPLRNAKICFPFEGKEHNGHVVDIEEDISSGERLYLIKFDDGDIMHMTSAEVVKHQVGIPSLVMQVLKTEDKIIGLTPGGVEKFCIAAADVRLPVSAGYFQSMVAQALQVSPSAIALFQDAEKMDDPKYLIAGLHSIVVEVKQQRRRPSQEKAKSRPTAQPTPKAKPKAKRRPNAKITKKPAAR